MSWIIPDEYPRPTRPLRRKFDALYSEDFLESLGKIKETLRNPVYIPKHADSPASLTVETPGWKKEHLKIQQSGDRLSVFGIKPNSESSETTDNQSEKRFEIVVRLANRVVDIHNIKYEDGVLTIPFFPELEKAETIQYPIP